MTIRDLKRILEAVSITTGDSEDLEVHSACGADLMSDVMAFTKEDVVLLTGLMNIQTIRTASLLDIQVIVFVRGKQPSKEMVQEAQDQGIHLLSTGLSLYLASGKLYEAGLKKGSMREL